MTIPQTISTSHGDDEQSVPRDYAASVCNMFAQLGATGVSILFGSSDGCRSSCADYQTPVTEKASKQSASFPFPELAWNATLNWGMCYSQYPGHVPFSRKSSTMPTVASPSDLE